MLHPGPLDIARARSLALSQVAVELPRPRGARGRRAVPRPQRRRRHHRRAGGDRSAAPAARARPDDARHRHRRRPGHQRHPGPRRDAVHDAGQRRRIAARAGGQDGRTASSPARSPPAATIRSSETEPSYLELTPDQWLADVFRAEMVRLGRTPVARGDRGGVAAGQHRHGQRHPGDAGHPPDRRHRRRRRVDPSAGVRRGRRRARAPTRPSSRAPIMLARTVVGAGRDRRRARPGAASCRQAERA